MAKLKLGPITDDKPVKVTLELPASLYADLSVYGELLADPGSAPVAPVRLIVPMLERFVATDRGLRQSPPRKAWSIRPR